MPPNIMNQPWKIDYRLSERLLAWYREARQPLPWRINPTPYRVWISEIMLQQTVITTVIPYFEKWMKAFPDIATLASASEQEVLLLWEGLGYYSRARNILNTARELVTHYQGKIPPDYMALVKLPGIGDYTACAILSIAFKLPYPVVDANVRRIFQRLCNLETLDRRAEQKLKRLLKELLTTGINEGEQFAVATNFTTAYPSVTASRENNAGDFNEGLMQLGQTICKTKQPLCTQCCVADFCQAFYQGRQNQIPAVKRQQTIEKQTALFIIINDNQVWLARKSKGPLKNLWSFPGTTYAERENFVKELELKTGFKFTFLRTLSVYTHHYTIYKDELFPLVYRLEAASPATPLLGDTGTWCALAQLKSYPFPSVYRKIIGELL